jgi:hypothetical protein
MRFPKETVIQKGSTSLIIKYLSEEEKRVDGYYE